MCFFAKEGEEIKSILFWLCDMFFDGKRWGYNIAQLEPYLSTNCD